MSEFYSRVGYFGLIKEVAVNTPLTPTTYVGINSEDMATEYAYTPTMEIAGNRTLNMGSVKNAIPAPIGSVNINVEPKNFGHFLNGVFGLTSSPRLKVANTTNLSVGATIDNSSTFTAVVSHIDRVNNIIVCSSFTAGDVAVDDTIDDAATGGTFSANLDEYSASVYAHGGNLPSEISTGETYTCDIGYDDRAIRYMGCRFTALDALQHSDNVITANVKIMAQGQFRQARVTAITLAGEGAQTITVDQTYGLVAGDTFKIYRPSTGAFIALPSAGVYEHTIATVATSTTITATVLAADTAVGDLLVLAPATPSYTEGSEFCWIGGSTVATGGTIATAAAQTDINDFNLVIANNFEARHAATGYLMKDRFPATIIQTGLTGSGTLTTHHHDESWYTYLRQTAQHALSITHQGSLIGVTTYENEIHWSIPNVRLDPYQTNIGQDDVVVEEIPFTIFADSTEGYTAQVILVNDVASY